MKRPYGFVFEVSRAVKKIYKKAEIIFVQAYCHGVYRKIAAYEVVFQEREFNRRQRCRLCIRLFPRCRKIYLDMFGSSHAARAKSFMRNYHAVKLARQLFAESNGVAFYHDVDIKILRL